MKVLFVCSGNAHRSPLAEALLKKLRPDLDVDSAGVRVAIPVSEGVKEYLIKGHAEGYLKEYPEGLDSKRIQQYDIIVAMEQKHKDVISVKYPECQNRIVVWNIFDPYFAPNEHTEKIFEQIRQKVKELADSL